MAKLKKQSPQMEDLKKVRKGGVLYTDMRTKDKKGERKFKKPRVVITQKFPGMG